jgi:TPR repeat protein
MSTLGLLIIYALLSPVRMLVLAPINQQVTDELKTSAESGNADAQVRLGMSYATGDGVSVDNAEAVKWFRKAADQGNAAGEYSLGEMYLTGRGIAADTVQGVKWIRRAAEDGEPRAQFNLAAMYTEGEGVPKDFNEAAKWMRKAADQGLAAGQFGLGAMYTHGRGVPQSRVEAVKWYRKAAAQGDLAAMNNLALLLATSREQEVRNPREALLLAQKAVEIDPENATSWDTLGTAYFESEQPEKAAEAERRALSLKPDNSSYKKALERYIKPASR